MRSIHLRSSLVVIGLPLCASSVWALGNELGHRACVLGYSNSIFAPKSWPSRSLESLTQGQLGVVDPQNDHFYLLLAYRRLAGKAITPTDVDHLRPFDPCWTDGSRDQSGLYWAGSAVMTVAMAEWAEMRGQVRSSSSLETLTKGAQLPATGYSIPNCNADAFRNAARTLRSRVATYGKEDDHVVDWALGQDLVFAQCKTLVDVFPDAASPNAPEWFRADRNYQIAAAHFYAGQYGIGANLFDAISQDAKSPWREIAPYLAARAHLRRASQDGVQATEVPSLLDRARADLERVLASTSDSGLKRDASRLLQRVRLRIEPSAVQRELDRRLSAPTLDESVGQDVRDFDPRSPIHAEVESAEPLFGAWVNAMRMRAANTPLKGAVALDSELWLVAALNRASPENPEAPALVSRALAIPKSSAAYYTAQYHVVRLVRDHARALQIARQLLLLPDSEFSRQDKNHLKRVAIAHARTVADFAALAYRQPIDSSFAEDFPSQATLPVVDEETAKILNGALPLDTLHAIYRHPATPPPLRSELLSVVWVRSLVLKRWDVLRAMNAPLRARLPEASGLTQAIDAAPDNTEREAIAAILLGKYPGLVASISPEIRWASEGAIADLALPNMHRYLVQDGSRDNWWCSIPSGRYGSDAPPLPEVPVPEFVSAKGKRSWHAELTALQAIPNATDYLGKIILPWAAAHPRDPRLPDVLRALVRSARGGCIGPETVVIGRTAFRHLHRYFPKSDAALRTRTHG